MACLLLPGVMCWRLKNETFLLKKHRMISRVSLITYTHESEVVTKHTFFQDNKRKLEPEELSPRPVGKYHTGRRT